MVLTLDVFNSNGYPENFINNCFKTFLDNKHRIQEKMITVPNKPFFSPYFRPSPLETTTKLRKCIKGILNCCKLHIVFKSQNRLTNAFHYKDHIPKEPTSGGVYKFQFGLCNVCFYGKCVRHLNVRTGEHIRISPLTRMF